MNIFVTFLLLLAPHLSLAAGLEEIVQDNISKAQKSIEEQAAGAVTPGFSRGEAELEGDRIASKDESTLKAEANQKISQIKTGKGNSAESALSSAMDKKPLDGFESHVLFQKAENIWADPVTAMNNLQVGDCTARVNNAQNHYKKVIKKEKKFDEILEERICERPAGNIVCEKMLRVSCEGEEICSFAKDEEGLFTSKSNRELIKVSGGLRLKYDGTTLELGNQREYNYDAGENGCVIKEFTAKFYIGKLERVSNFALTEVFENNLLHIEINGHVVYNGLGGNDLKVVSYDGPNSVISAGSGKSGYCGMNTGDTWKSARFDILKSGFLKEGENDMKIKLAVHWLGHAGVRIDARKKCCTRLTDKWEKRCWTE